MQMATRRQALGGAGERSGHHNRSIAAQAFIQQWKIINCGGLPPEGCRLLPLGAFRPECLREGRGPPAGLLRDAILPIFCISGATLSRNSPVVFGPCADGGSLAPLRTR